MILSFWDGFVSGSILNFEGVVGISTINFQNLYRHIPAVSPGTLTLPRLVSHLRVSIKQPLWVLVLLAFCNKIYLKCMLYSDAVIWLVKYHIYMTISLDHPTNITKISWGVKWPPQAAGHFCLDSTPKKAWLSAAFSSKVNKLATKKWASCPISDLPDLLCYCIFTYFWSDKPLSSHCELCLKSGPIFNSIDAVHGKLILHDLGCIKSKIHSRNNSLPLGTLRISGISAIKKSFHRTNFIV